MFDWGVYVFSAPDHVIKVGGTTKGRLGARVWEQQRSGVIGGPTYWRRRLPELYLVELLPTRAFSHDGIDWMAAEMTANVEAFLSDRLHPQWNFRKARAYRGGLRAAQAYLSTLKAPCADERCPYQSAPAFPRHQVLDTFGRVVALACGEVDSVPWLPSRSDDYLDRLWRTPLRVFGRFELISG